VKEEGGKKGQKEKNQAGKEKERNVEIEEYTDKLIAREEKEMDRERDRLQNRKTLGQWSCSFC
jgi:hypothetical protein